MVQQAAGRLAPDLRGLFELCPFAPQRHSHRLGVLLPDPKAASVAAFAPAVVGEAPDHTPEPHRQRIGQSLVFENLGGDAQMQRRGLTLVQLRRRDAHMRDQRGFQRLGFVEAPARGAIDSGMNEGGQGGIVAGDAVPFKVVKRATHAFGTEARDAHQLVGGEALVSVGLDQGAGDAQQLRAVGVRDVGSFQQVARPFYRIHPQRRRENPNRVLLSIQQRAFFQPGDGSAHPGVVGGRVALERLVLVLAEDFAGARHYLSVEPLFPVQPAQRPQDGVDFLSCEPGARRQAELPLDIVRRVEQHATRRLPVAPCAPRLLEIILQRAGNVGVDHQPDVRLVDPHAEGVGRRDRAQFAADEALLHVLLGLRRPVAVEEIRRNILQLQIFGDFLGTPPGCAIDDGPAGRVRWQMRRQSPVNIIEFFAA